MNTTAFMLLLGVVVLLTISGANGWVRCYVCNRCVDIGSNTPMAPNCNFCSKNTSYVAMGMTNRGCAMQCQNGSVGLGFNSQYCCDTDLCNAATSHLPSTLLLLLGAAALGLLLHWHH